MTQAWVLQRFRAVGLRPTIARIGVMQIIESAEPMHLGADDVFRLMLERGTRTSMGTVYRTVHDLEVHGLLLRAWAEHRKAMYRLKPVGFDAHRHQLVCSTCARSFAFTDAVLQARLDQFAMSQGLSIAGRAVTIEVACMGCAGTAHRPCAASPRHHPKRMAGAGACA